MKSFAILAALPVITVAALTAPTTARAGDGGAVAAGVAGGFVGGLVFGSALAPQPNYGPPPVYGYWDAWRGVWVRPHIRVCE